MNEKTADVCRITSHISVQTILWKLYFNGIFEYIYRLNPVLFVLYEAFG